MYSPRTARVKNFVPSELLRSIRIKGGMSEVVIERRNADENDKSIKRKPSYIVMMVDSLEKDSFNSLKNVYNDNLTFLTDENKKAIQSINTKRGIIKYFQTNCPSQIVNIANSQGVYAGKLAEQYAELIMKAKIYDNSLKAASDFDIPLVVLNREHYFKRLLEKCDSYSEGDKKNILERYKNGDSKSKEKSFKESAKTIKEKAFNEAAQTIEDTKYTGREIAILSDTWTFQSHQEMRFRFRKNIFRGQFRRT